MRRHGIAYDAYRESPDLLILLIMELQTSVVAIIFSKKDSTWIEAIAAALGVVSNTAAIYLGFSASIRKLHATLVHDQDAQLTHQNWFKRVILWLIGVPNRAVALIGSVPSARIWHLMRACCLVVWSVDVLVPADRWYGTYFLMHLICNTHAHASF